MLSWLIRRRLATFERAHGADMSYARAILAASPRGFRRFARVFGIAAHREDVPLEAWHAAKVAATLAEDCGPCVQLVVALAERDGVDAAVLRGVLAGDEAVMGADAALAVAFARATLRRDLAASEALRERIVGRWGARALVSLALAIAAARVFPTVKYALGHGAACSRVRVGGAEMPVRPPPAEITPS